MSKPAPAETKKLDAADESKKAPKADDGPPAANETEVDSQSAADAAVESAADFARRQKARGRKVN